jgi:hypothetical protein
MEQTRDSDTMTRGEHTHEGRQAVKGIRKTATRHASAPVLAIAVALVLASCGGADPTTTTSGSTTTVTEPSAPAPLGDGEHFGFIRDVGPGVLVFDPAELLTGEAAVEAAREDGVVGEGEDLPNDFYIDDPESETVDLPIAGDVVVSLLGFDTSGAIEPTTVTPDALLGLWDGSEDADGFYGFVVGELPVRVVIAGGIVATVTQEYLP